MAAAIIAANTTRAPTVAPTATQTPAPTDVRVGQVVRVKNGGSGWFLHLQEIAIYNEAGENVPPQAAGAGWVKR